MRAYRILHLPRPGIVELVVGVLRGDFGQLLDRLDLVGDAALGGRDDVGDCDERDVLDDPPSAFGGKSA